MIVIDSHCDTISFPILEKGYSLYSNKAHIDLKRMQNFKGYVQFFATFADAKFFDKCIMKRTIKIIDEFYKQLDLYKEHISLCKSYKDIEDCLDSSKIGAILSIEGGEALEGSIFATRMFYRLGVRSICLTWNYRNEIADGVGELESKGGLTCFGKELIREMNKLGMIIDVSHINEPGFWDVASLSYHPFIASHSNAAALCNNKRNLTDEQIKALAQKNGVMGINLYPQFLNNSGNASIKDIIEHIEYILALVGPAHVGLGADFDGIDTLPNGICGVQDIGKIFNELSKLNYSQETIEKISHGNLLRVIKEIMNS